MKNGLPDFDVRSLAYCLYIFTKHQRAERFKPVPLIMKPKFRPIAIVMPFSGEREVPFGTKATKRFTWTELQLNAADVVSFSASGLDWNIAGFAGGQ